jgi:hypothetical protein
MKQLASVHMTSAAFLRDRALKENLPELAAIADQLDDYEELKSITHYYVTACARMKPALEMIAQTYEGRCARNIMEARALASEALRYAEDQ